jgi:hypothetical protein
MNAMNAMMNLTTRVQQLGISAAGDSDNNYRRGSTTFSEASERQTYGFACPFACQAY